MGAAETVFESVRELATRMPAMSEALDRVMAELQRQPRSINEKRSFDARMAGVSAAFQGLWDAANRVQAQAGEAEKERQFLFQQRADMLREMSALQQRVATLERELAEWQDEYEPDSAPDRPALFSNVRRALAVFRS